MILICGTKLKVKDLPDSDVLEYAIENDESSLVLVLGTFLATDDFYEYAFVSASYKTLVQDAAITVEYFKNDTELLKLLEAKKIDNTKIKNIMQSDEASDFQMIADLQSELDETTATLSKTKNQVEELEDVIVEKDALIESLKEELESKNKELDEQSQTLESNKTDSEDTRVKIEELEEKIGVLEDSLSEKESVLKVKEAKIKSFESGDNPALDELQEKFDALNAELDEYKNGNNPALDELQIKYDALEKEYEEYKNTDSPELVELREKFEQLTTEYNQYKETDSPELVELKGKYEELEKQLEDKKIEGNADLEELQKKYDELEQEYEDYKNTDSPELIELKQKFEELQKEFDEYKEADNPELVELKEKYAELEQEYEDYKSTDSPELLALRAQYEELQTEKEELENGKTPAHLAVEQELEELKAEYEEYRNTETPEMTELKSKYATLQQEKAVVDTEIESLRTAVSNSNSSALETQAIINALQEQLNEKGIELTKQKTEFELKISSLSLENSKIGALNNSITTLNSNILEQQETIKALNLKIADLETQSAQKDIDLSKIQSELKIANENIAFADSMKEAALKKQKLETEAETVALRNDLMATKQRLDDLKKAYSDEVTNSSSDISYNVKSGNKEYDVYVVKPKTSIGLKLNSSEQGYFNFTNSVVLLTYCGASSLNLLRSAAQEWINQGMEFCLIDFTGDPYFTLKFNLMSEATGGKTTGDLVKQSGNINSGMFKKVKQAYFVPCVPFNDIALLEQNWGKLLNDIANELPSAMPIVLLLNNFESFITRFVVQKLSSKYNTMLFMQGSPTERVSVQAFLQTVETENIGIIAGDVTPATAPKLQAILSRNKLSKGYPTGKYPPMSVLQEYLA